MSSKKLRSLLLALVLSLMLAVPPTAYASTKTPTLTIDNITVGMTKQEKKVYKKLKAQKKTKAYREGRKWGNEKSYSLGDRVYCWDGRYWNGGLACHAFALKLSDIVFGKNAPIQIHESMKRLKVGDVIRFDEYKRTMHSAVVVKIAGKKLVLAEGNYGGRVHWGRVITKKWAKKHCSWILTRY